MQTTGVSASPGAARGTIALGPILVSTLWLAWYAQWIPIPAVILPAQVQVLVGRAAAPQDAGLVIAAGSLVALLITPLAGALSDASRSRFGRRRPFLVVGVTLSSLALALLWLAARRGGLALYALAYVNLQFWWNWAAGPYAAFIPDTMPKARQGIASGWTNVMTVLGAVLGSVLTNLLYSKRPDAVAAAFISLNLACLAATLLVREAPAQGGAPAARSVMAFLRSFLLSPRQHPSFYWVLATRFFTNMGIWSVTTFLLYYIETVLGLPEAPAQNLLSLLLGVGAALAIPASLLAMRATDRFGLVAVVQTAAWAMAAATASYVAISLHPAVALMAPALAVYAIANGAYGAADWLLALKVLPGGQSAGKDFGVWHVCMVAPQIIGPLSTGFLIGAVKAAASAQLAYEVAFGLAALWFILGAWMVRRVRLPTEATG
jgi:Na+/melibiose symporter-like transporter